MLCAEAWIVRHDVAAERLGLQRRTRGRRGRDQAVAPYSTFADLQGDLVAKFDRVTIFAGVSPPEALLVFSGRMSEGTEFSASIVVRVKN